ncbi:MAG: hypothetical protein LBQ43_04140 [Holosporales bacterium]|jgi:hypothetical protein|nr:hypothetical protein [Holosporales bacterium]
MLGSQDSAFYPMDQSIYSKTLFCHNVASQSSLLPNTRRILGDPRVLDNYADFDDGITVFAKLSKIFNLIASVMQNHPQCYDNILETLEGVLGRSNDGVGANTVFGYLNELVQTIRIVRPDIDSRNFALIGPSFSGFDSKIASRIGSETTFGIEAEASPNAASGNLITSLNSAIYLLSTRYIVNLGVSLTNKLKDTFTQISTNDPTLRNMMITTLEYFAHTTDTLAYASLFLNNADLAAIYATVGSASDADTTLSGLVNQIDQLVTDSPVDLEAQLTSLLEVSPSASSVFGRLSTVLAPVHTQLVNIINNNKLRKAITPFFNEHVKGTDFELYQSLISKLSDVATDITLADTTADETDDFFVAGFDPKATIISLMNINKLAYDIFICSQNFEDPSHFLGTKFTLIGLNTLSSFVTELVDGFYLHPLRKLLTVPTLEGARSVLSDAIAVGERISEDENLHKLSESQYYGKYRLVDFESPDALYRKIMTLQGALDGCSADHATAAYLANSIGIRTNQPGTIWSEISRLLEEPDLDACKLAIEKGKTLINDMLVNIHQGFFSYYFKTINIMLEDASDAYGILAYESRLDEALHDLKLNEIAAFFEDDSYTFRPPIILDIYGIIGTLLGNACQTYLSENVLSLSAAAVMDVNFINQRVGNRSEIRESPNSTTYNTLYGNVGWIWNQIENNKICSCVHTGMLLGKLSNEILSSLQALNFLGENLYEAIVQHPTTDFVDKALKFVNNALNTIDSHLESIYLLKHALTSTSQCQAYKINPHLQTVYNVLHAFVFRIQDLFEGGFTVQETAMPSEVDPEYFYESLDDVALNMQSFASKIQEFCEILSAVQFLPVSDQASQFVAAAQNSLANIQNFFEKVRQTTALANHAGEDKTSTFASFFDSFGNVITCVGELDGLSALYNSHPSFLVSNIARLLLELNNAIEATFIDSTLDVDSFIRNRQFDQYISALEKMGTCIIHELFPKTSAIGGNMRQKLRKKALNSSGRAKWVVDENERTEKALQRITNTLHCGIKLWSKFASDVLSQSITTPARYARTEELFRGEVSLNKITEGINSIANTMNTKVLGLVKQSASLCRSPEVMNALKTFIECITQIEKAPNDSICRLHLQADSVSSFGQSLEELKGGLNSLAEEFDQSRCCSPLAIALFEIKSETKDATMLFDALIDAMFGEQSASVDTLALQMQFAEMGIGLRKIAEVINALSQKIREVPLDFSRKLCFTDEVQPEVLAILGAVRGLKAALAQTVVGSMEEADVDPEATSEATPGLSPAEEEGPDTPAPEAEPETASPEEEGPEAIAPEAEEPETASPADVSEESPTPSPTNINESNELFEIASLLGEWGKKLQKLASITKYKVTQSSKALSASPVVPELCISTEGGPNDSDLSNFLTIFEATPYLAPFFTSISQAFSKLSRSLSMVTRSGKHFCIRGPKNFAPVVTLMAQNTGKIVDAIQLLIDMFEPIKARTFAYSMQKLVVDNAHHWLVGEGNTVLYQHNTDKKLFVTRVTTDTAAALMYGSDEISWDAAGAITAPTALAGKSIGEFAPVSLFTVIQQDVETLECVRQNARASHQKFGKLMS